MQKGELKELVNAAWERLLAATPNQATNLLAECLDKSERIEKDHRRFIAHGVPNARYRLTTTEAARYFVVKLTSEAIPVPKTWTDFQSWRADMPLCQALREQIQGAGKGPALIQSEAFKAIDYAGDIAL